MSKLIKFSFLLTLTSLSLLHSGLSLGCIKKGKSDAFDVANNLLTDATRSNSLKDNQRAARELIGTVSDCEVQDVLTKLGDLREMYDHCDESSQKQVRAMVDLMYDASRSNPTKEQVSERRLNKLVLKASKDLYATCMDSYQEELYKLDSGSDWMLNSPNLFNILIRYKIPSMKERLIYRNAPTEEKVSLKSYREANFDALRQLSSPRARKGWMKFLMTFHNDRDPVIEKNLKTGHWEVPRRNVARLYDLYVTKSCQVFKQKEMADLMSRVEGFIATWRLEAGDYFTNDSEILGILLNFRICKELDKEDPSVQIDLITKHLSDEKLKSLMVQELGDL